MVSLSSFARLLALILRFPLRLLQLINLIHGTRRSGEPPKKPFLILRPLPLAGALLAIVCQTTTQAAAYEQINDFGTVGLLQMPSARMSADGDFRAGFSIVDQYHRYFVGIQALPFLEGSFKYTDVRNRFYSGNRAFSGTQKYKDRGFDLKIRLVREDETLPDISVGFRDLGGTSLFAAEYIVATKRFWDVDVTLGLGFGNMATRAHIENPLSNFGDVFKDRGTVTSTPGSFNAEFFGGPNAAFFGGIVWDTPIPDLHLTVEYDSNDYQSESLGNQFEVDSPINAALTYRPFPFMQATFGYERGNEVMARIVMTGNLHAGTGMPKFDPALSPVRIRPQGSSHRARSELSQTSLGQTIGSIRGRASIDLDQLSRFTDKQARLLGMTLQEVRPRGNSLLIKLGRIGALTPTASPANLITLVSDKFGPLPGFSRIRAELTGAGQPTVTASIGLDPKPQKPTPTDPATAAAKPQTQTSQRTENAAPEAAPDDIFKALSDTLKPQRIYLDRLALEDSTARIRVRQSSYREFTRVVGRTARAAALVLPDRYEFLAISMQELGLEPVTVTVRRTEIEKHALGRGSIEEIVETMTVTPRVAPASHAQVVGRSFTDDWPRFSWSLRPSTQQIFGRPEQFVFFGLFGVAGISAQLAPGLEINASYTFEIESNFDDVRQNFNSQLPRVRSNIALYQLNGRDGITTLNASWLFQISDEFYGSIAGGIFEQMFGGVQGEILYRPHDKNWSLGLDLSWVRQRGFEQDFEFLDYETITGHLTFYYHLPIYNLDIVIPAGRYLAKDVGATLDLSREFDSGTRVGIFATKTDVSAEEFGEGSFDKGFYITIPLDELLVRSTTGRGNFIYRPVIRDGGAMVARIRPLNGVLNDTRQDVINRKWRRMFK